MTILVQGKVEGSRKRRKLGRSWKVMSRTENHSNGSTDRCFILRQKLTSSSSSLSLKCALRESGCRIGHEPTKMSRDHFWQSVSRETNVEVSALGVQSLLHQVFRSNVR